MEPSMTLENLGLYDRRTGAAIEEEDVPLDPQFGELQVSEYIVFLLALDTYMKWVEEATKAAPADEMTRMGLRLLKQADQLHMGSIEHFLDESLPSAVHKKMLAKALKYRPSVDGAARRALQIRTLLSRGGSSTMRAIFKTNKALLNVREAIQASMVDDPDAALDKFAVIQVRNPKIRAWIDLAAKTATPTAAVPTPVAAAARSALDATSEILTEKVHAEATTIEGLDHTKNHEAMLTQVQTEAQEAAKRSMDRSGEEDVPPSKSEVVGIATAAAMAAATNPEDDKNIPEPIRHLDQEQRAAALTDGRVLIAAGAGSGKSTTLVARVAYLVKERKVIPSKILAVSFNKSAGGDLAKKIGKVIGGVAEKQARIGTLHSTFREIIFNYGTADERISMGGDPNKREPNGFVKAGGAISRAVSKFWTQCYPKESPPKSKKMMLWRTKWAGNNIDYKQAQAEAKGQEQIQAAKWYEFYEGFKGAIPGWEPPCPSAKEWQYHKTKKLMQTAGDPKGIRLGDFDDMISTALKILKRNPKVVEEYQKRFDHILVDECQDLNTAQWEVIQLLAGHITDGSDGKSLWMVGDASQSIYGFRGAKVEQFAALKDAPGWKTRMISTNYRSAPKIVTAANSLIRNNQTGLMIEQKPVAGKAEDSGNISVMTPGSHAEGAMMAADQIKQYMVSDGEPPSNFAVLCRTNVEIHDFETACIIRGIPYARKGASSFLGSPETKSFLSYVQLVTGDDFTKMQEALKEVLKKPNRLLGAYDAIDRGVDSALSKYASRKGVDRKSLNPVMILRDRAFAETLAAELKPGKNPRYWVGKFLDLGEEIRQLKTDAAIPGATTEELFDSILNVKGTEIIDKPDGSTEFKDVTFKDTISTDLKVKAPDDDEADEDDEAEEGAATGPAAKHVGLGSIGFLYQLLQPDPSEPSLDASTPTGFKMKMEKYAARARELRIDLDKWNKEQQNLDPSDRRPPPGVFLGTVHATKGAEWKSTFVVMPKGVFPMETRVKPGEPPPPPEEVAEQMESERRLGYVAMTRAISNLNVICPDTNAAGRGAGVSPFVTEAGLQVPPRLSTAPRTAYVYNREPDKISVEMEIPTDPNAGFPF